MYFHVYGIRYEILQVYLYQQVTIVHICPCLELTELKLQNNKISNVPDTVSAISPLSHLKQLFIKGTPTPSSVLHRHIALLHFLY